MLRKWLYILAAIVLLAAAIRIGTIAREDLWCDELFSRRVALLPLHPALAAIEEDLVHPPPYYMLLKAGVMTWGASPL